MGKDWQEKLCGCFSNPLICVMACFIPGAICAIQAVAVDKATGNGVIVPLLLNCFFGAFGAACNRETIRKKLEIDGAYCDSCCTWCWCAMCASTQEYREVHGHHSSEGHHNH